MPVRREGPLGFRRYHRFVAKPGQPDVEHGEAADAVAMPHGVGGRDARTDVVTYDVDRLVSGEAFDELAKIGRKRRLEIVPQDISRT